jgi:hypothetical protein
MDFDLAAGLRPGLKVDDLKTGGLEIDALKTDGDSGLGAI